MGCADAAFAANAGRQKDLEAFSIELSYEFVSFDPGPFLRIFPQQLEKLGVLPTKLCGGLGQRPETWHQVPQGSSQRFHTWRVLSSTRVPHKGSGSPRSQVTKKIQLKVPDEVPHKGSRQEFRKKVPHQGFPKMFQDKGSILRFKGSRQRFCIRFKGLGRSSIFWRKGLKFKGSKVFKVPDRSSTCYLRFMFRTFDAEGSVFGAVCLFAIVEHRNFSAGIGVFTLAYDLWFSTGARATWNGRQVLLWEYAKAIGMGCADAACTTNAGRLNNLEEPLSTKALNLRVLIFSCWFFSIDMFWSLVLAWGQGKSKVAWQASFFGENMTRQAAWGAQMQPAQQMPGT